MNTIEEKIKGLNALGLFYLCSDEFLPEYLFTPGGAFATAKELCDFLLHHGVNATVHEEDEFIRAAPQELEKFAESITFPNLTTVKIAEDVRTTYTGGKLVYTYGNNYLHC